MSDDLGKLLREWSDRDLGPDFRGNRNASLGYIAAAALERAEAERDEWKRKYGDANVWGLQNSAAWKARAEQSEAIIRDWKVRDEQYAEVVAGRDRLRALLREPNEHRMDARGWHEWYVGFVLRCEAALKEPAESLCPHGNPVSECNACYEAADHAYDATREDAIFGRGR